ncbi:MAG TPA: restriction endonuclease subunit S [Acidimicrobiia bacterium]|nr:restriction endonuclease subunit S [Acidimicrobiia bacterium]
MTFDQIPADWVMATLGEVATDGGLVGGPFGSMLGRKDYVADGVPVIRGTNISDSGRFKLDDLVFVTQEKVTQDLLRNTAAPGDIVLTQRGTLGQAGVIPDDTYPLWVVSQSQERLRVDRAKADRDFVYFVLRSPAMVNEIARRAITTGVPHINLGITQELPIPLPPLEEQHRIALILNYFDDKIENSQRIAEILEEIAGTLFKARFVDFVDHDDLVESEIGWIPQEWKVASLSEITRVLTRGRGPAYVDEGGVQVLNQKCIRDGRVSFELARRNDEDRRSSTDRRVELGDVLINSTGVGTLGRVAQVSWLPEATTIDSHVTMVRADDTVTEQDYLAMALLMRQGDLERLGHGSTGQTELTRSRLAEFSIPVPPMDEQRALSKSSGPIRGARAALERESLTIATLRDALLPKLISGQIRVPATGPDEPAA